MVFSLTRDVISELVTRLLDCEPIGTFVDKDVHRSRAIFRSTSRGDPSSMHLNIFELKTFYNWKLLECVTKKSFVIKGLSEGELNVPCFSIEVALIHNRLIFRVVHKQHCGVQDCEGAQKGTKLLLGNFFEAPASNPSKVSFFWEMNGWL